MCSFFMIHDIVFKIVPSKSDATICNRVFTASYLSFKPFIALTFMDKPNKLINPSASW